MPTCFTKCQSPYLPVSPLLTALRKPFSRLCRTIQPHLCFAMSVSPRRLFPDVACFSAPPVSRCHLFFSAVCFSVPLVFSAPLVFQCPCFSTPPSLRCPQPPCARVPYYIYNMIYIPLSCLFSLCCRCFLQDAGLFSPRFLILGPLLLCLLVLSCHVSPVQPCLALFYACAACRNHCCVGAGSGQTPV